MITAIISLIRKKPRLVCFAWHHVFAERSQRKVFILTLFFVSTILLIYPLLLGFIEKRVGVVLQDPVLYFLSAHIGVINMTIPIFTMLYGCVALFSICTISNPMLFLKAIQLYCVAMMLRICFMLLVPLDPSPHIIVLQDPVVAFLMHSAPYTRALFFSGHTTMMAVLCLCAPNSFLRKFFAACGLFVVIALLLQQAHYCIDVVVAPFVVYSCYKCLFKGFYKTFGLT